MNIYNLCISFILKHDYRKLLGRSKSSFNTLIMFYHMKDINNLIQHPSLPFFLHSYLPSIHPPICHRLMITLPNNHLFVQVNLHVCAHMVSVTVLGPSNIGF